VRVPAAFERTVGFWKKPHHGLNFSAVTRLAVNEPSDVKLRPSHFLAHPLSLASIRLNEDVSAHYRWPARFVLSRSGTLHGLGVWFEYHLSKHVALSTEPPMKVGSPPWANTFFPFGQTVVARRGDRLEAEMHLSLHHKRNIYKWTFALQRRVGRRWVCVAEGTHSNFAGLVGSAEALHRLSPSRPLQRTAWGDAQLCALSLCDGRRTRLDIEREISRRFGSLFTSPAEVSQFVAEVLKETRA
jgi:hypothetical protein